MLVLLTIVTGIIYPLAVTGLAQVFFRRQANGSLIVDNERVVGSELIGQSFDAPQYFWGRLSATQPYPYNAAASSGANLGPLSPDLAEAVQARLDALRVADPGNASSIPVDLVTSSASGLDPHISVAAALYQVPRVAHARGLTEEAVLSLVERYSQGRPLGILGEPSVNVLELNLALDGVQ
jgi:K+-transporting ATPase ATPase C chain